MIVELERWITALTSLLLAGCAAVGGTDTPAADPAATPAAASTPSGSPDLAAPEEVATDLDVPWGLTFLPSR